MELNQYTKQELVAMMKAAMAPISFYSSLEVKTVMGGKPFAKPSERIATKAIREIQDIQTDALERINKKTEERGKNESTKKHAQSGKGSGDIRKPSNPTTKKVPSKRTGRVRKKGK